MYGKMIGNRGNEMNNRNSLKWIILSLVGVMVLTVEVLMVVMIQKLDRISGSYSEDISRYFQEPIIYWPIGVVIGIIIGGMIMFFKDNR